MAWSSSRRLFGQGTRALMAAAKSSSAKATTVDTATATVAETATKPLSGIKKPVPVSPILAEFLGASEASRSQVIKKVWEHIKLHSLQNPKKMTEILCDDKLKTIFDGREQVGMMEMARLLNPHFVKVNTE